MASKKSIKDFSNKDMYGEVISSLSKENYKEFFEDQYQKDNWVEVDINTLTAFGVEDNMLTVRENEEDNVTICESRIVDFFTESITKTDVSVNTSLENIAECINGESATRLIIKFPSNDKYYSYPLARTAREGLYGRTGTGVTQVDNSLESTDKLTEYNPYARASSINEHARTWKRGKAQLLIRNERLIACQSEQYAILPMKRLIEEMEKTLTKHYSSFEFVSGKTSNSFTKILYRIEDEKTQNEVRDLFKGTPYESYEVGILFTSSDTGTNCATACCVLYKDDLYFIISKEHKLKHSGKAVCEDFALETEKCFSSTKENISKLKEMMNESVFHLPDMIRHVGALIGLNKKTTCAFAVSDEVTSSGTQFDVYLAICRIVETELGEYKHSPEGIFKMTEMANEMLYIKNLANLDAPFEWVDNVKFS